LAAKDEKVSEAAGKLIGCLVNDLASCKKRFIEALITVNGGHRINLSRTHFSRIVTDPYLQSIAQRSVMYRQLLAKKVLVIRAKFEDIPDCPTDHHDIPP
jgi:hypothetical protein